MGGKAGSSTDVGRAGRDAFTVGGALGYALSMRPRLPAFLLLLLSLFPCVAGLHAIDKARYRELNAKARALAKQQDWQGVREVLATLGKELPAPTPRYLLTVASVETHLGHKEEALKWLASYAAMGISYNVGGDDDLKPLLAEPGFA